MKKLKKPLWLKQFESFIRTTEGAFGKLEADFGLQPRYFSIKKERREKLSPKKISWDDARLYKKPLDWAYERFEKLASLKAIPGIIKKARPYYLALRLLPRPLFKNIVKEDFERLRKMVEARFRNHGGGILIVPHKVDRRGIIKISRLHLERDIEKTDHGPKLDRLKKALRILSQPA